MTGAFTESVDVQAALAWLEGFEELPGANSQGATLDEARENLAEAARQNAHV